MTVLDPRTVCFRLCRKAVNAMARRDIKRNPELWKILTAYLHETKSTGCNFTDYWELYRHVRNNKPRMILECGTGTSTVVMAYALMENAKDGVEGKIVSMEESGEYHALAKKLLPSVFNRYVEIVLSPVVEDYYSIFRGVRYKDIPKADYDFAFIDGPSYKAPSDGMLSFDFDFIHILKKSAKPIGAIIDKRVSTCYVLQKVLGTDIVKYDGIRHLGYCRPCLPGDLKDFDKSEPSRSFNKSFRLFSNSRLDLEFS